jgi:acyl-CoA dehydrogenase
MGDLTYLDWPFFDDSHRVLATDLTEWINTHLSVFEQERRPWWELAREIFIVLAEGGWLRLGVPDGKPSNPLPDLRAVCLLREALAYSSGIADVAFSEPWIASLPISIFGGASQKEAYLPSFIQGKCLPAFALSEPEAGSDVAAIATEARREPGEFIISGRKQWTSNGGRADIYIVFARTESGTGAAGISAFIVDGATPGICLEQELPVLSPHSVGILRFDGCRVPASSLLGEAGQGFKIAMTALELFRPTVGAATLGFARRAMDAAVGRSLQRTAFGKSISEHQLVQQKVAEMATEIDAAALLVFRAAWLKDHDQGRITREAAMAKLYSTEMAQRVIDKALQIFGGMGVVSGSIVERLYREVRAFRIFDGSSEIQTLIIAKEALKTHKPL